MHGETIKYVSYFMCVLDGWSDGKPSVIFVCKCVVE